MKTILVLFILATMVFVTVIAQSEKDQITIAITSDAKAKVSHLFFPDTFVSSVDVNLVSNHISRILAVDEDNILLAANQNEYELNVATLGASRADLTYNANIISYESGIFKINYQNEGQTKVILPPLSKLVSLNTIPIEVNEREFVLPPGKISLSYSIRQTTSQEFVISQQGMEHSVEFITGARIDEFSANESEIRFLIKDKAVILGIIPTTLFSEVKGASLNGETVDFQNFFQNSTHSWVRIDPHEKGLVKIYSEQEQKTIEGGGCLIATATYGSEMAPQVQLLREIRDNQLMNTAFGTSFMTGFNQLYYSFSPHIADMERENPAFKEVVKIGITPLLSSLSVMEYAESDSEVLGYGIGVILMNLGMYFGIPIFLIYKINNIRTSGRIRSNQSVISIITIRSFMKYSLYGLIVFSILLISVNSAFAQISEEPPVETHPIQMILDMTKENANDALGDDAPTTAVTLYSMGITEYDNALAALEAGDIEAAEEFALIAMALFEDSTETVGVLVDPLVLGQIPPGFGSGVGSASEEGLSNGQGLGVGGVPPGIMKQLVAQNIFNIQNEITEIDFDADNLKDLISTNNLDVDLVEYDESVNLAKEILARGDIPNARAQLELANQIKDSLYDQIYAEVAEQNDAKVDEFVQNSINEIEEMLENGENLGLTKKAIRELESTLEVLKNGDIDEIQEKTSGNSEYAKQMRENRDNAPGNSGNAPGQNDNDNAPGNSGNAPGQNDNDNAPGNSGNDNEGGPSEIPNGFGAAGDNPSEKAFDNGKGLGLKNIPPGLAKFFGFESNDDSKKVPPGLVALFYTISPHDDVWKVDAVNSEYEDLLTPDIYQDLEKQMMGAEKKAEAEEKLCEMNPSHWKCTGGSPGDNGQGNGGQGQGQGGGQGQGQGGGQGQGQGGGQGSCPDGSSPPCN